MILVLTNYRTGSTTLCKQLAQQYSYENLDECFHESLVDIHKDVLRSVYSKNDVVVKLMPNHIYRSDIDNLLAKLVEVAEKIIVLVRKNKNWF